MFKISTCWPMWEEVNDNDNDEENNLISDQYNELLMAVSHKEPGKTRHDAALDSIEFAEKIYMAGKQLEGN